MSKTEFIKTLRPHAVEAIGRQHPFLVSWALAKAGIECGWNLNNVLIVNANNALGIKGGFVDDKGKWILFDVPVFYKQDSLADGRDDGLVPWRKFDSLVLCFDEFANMVNRRGPYKPARDAFVKDFENIYTEHTPGAADQAAKGIIEVHDVLTVAGLMDAKGRLV